jgi:hypothetical protein
MNCGKKSTIISLFGGGISGIFWRNQFFSGKYEKFTAYKQG